MNDIPTTPDEYYEFTAEMQEEQAMQQDNVYMRLREALSDVHFELQLDMHELHQSDPNHDWSEDPQMQRLNMQFRVFENLAKSIDELLFPVDLKALAEQHGVSIDPFDNEENNR